VREVLERTWSKTVGGGWGQAGDELELDVRGFIVEEAYINVNKAGMEPPLFGTSRVYVDGTVIEWNDFGKWVRIPAQNKYKIKIEKTGFGYIGGFTASGTLKLVGRRPVVGLSGPTVSEPFKPELPGIPWYAWLVLGILGILMIIVVLSVRRVV
jgi:hypothetical protein